MNSPGIRRGNPLQSKEKAKDFILISEFSELVGPISVLTIPQNDDLKFDKASFSVRVLSSDLQANRKFAIVHDSQILQSIPNEEMYSHAYIHYITLNDISARGYVRQFCMSYISRKERKLVENFLALKENFEKVSTMMRCANLTLFFIDLIHKLKDLYYTADLIKEEGLANEDTDDNPDFNASHLYAEFDFCKQDVPERDIRVVRQQIEEATEILNTVMEELNSSSNRRATQHMGHGGSYSLDHIEQLISSIKLEGASFLLHKIETDYQPCRTMAHTTYRFDRKLKTLSQLCGKYFYQTARHELDLIQKRFSRQFFVLNIEEEESKILKPLSSLLTIGRTPVVNVLESKKSDCQKVTGKPRPYKFSSLQHLQGEQLPFIHADSDETDQYSFDTAFLQSTDCLDMYPIYMDPVSNHDLCTINNPVENVDEIGLMLHGLQSLDDHVISGPASLATSDQQEQYLTPQYSDSPSMHSLSNSSLAATPTSNAAVEDLTSEVNSKPSAENTSIITDIPLTDDVIKGGFDTSSTVTSSIAIKHLTNEATGFSVKHDTISGVTDDVLVSGFVLVDYPKNTRVGNRCDIDFEGTLKPTDLATASKLSTVKKPGDVDDEEHSDTLVPAHLKVFGVHGNSSGIGVHGDNTRSRAGIPVEDQVVGITDNNINSEYASSISTLSSRRNSGTLPELKIGKLISYGTNSPEYYTPTDRLPRDPLSPLVSARTPLFEQPVVRVAGKIPLISYSDQCTRHSKLRPGRRILEFIKNYPNCQDFFYALLSGRTLVISGPPQMEQKIRNVVMTLWMFVPGYSSQCQVIPWHKEPIKLQDLQHFKLIGQSSDGHSHHVIPRHIMPYISWWNYRDGKLYTPHYNGNLLNSISKRTDWKSEPMLMAHIHSVLLDIASKAFVYYHLYCVAKQQEEQAEPLHSPLRPREHITSNRTNVFPKLNIDKQCDKDIIQYFSEVISHQQLAEWDEQTLNRNTGIKLNYKKCMEQTCRAH